MDSFDLRKWEGFKAAGGNLNLPAIVEEIVIDSRRIHASHSLFVALPGKSRDGHQYVKDAVEAGARYVIVQKGWRPTILQQTCQVLYVEDPLLALQEIAQTYRLNQPAKVVGIVGSYGKTMVKDLLLALTQGQHAAVASPESFNSQIGVPLSLLTIQKHHSLALIEAGFSKRSEMDRLAKVIVPDYTILTRLGKKHVTTLGDLPEIAQETVKFLKAPSASWHLVPNHPYLTNFLNETSAYHYFWNENQEDLPHAFFLTQERASKMSYQIHFPDGRDFIGQTTFGFYYYLDLLNITIKAAWLLGVSSEHIIQTLRCYLPEPMRTEIWKTFSGSTLINDIYCSDPQSVDRALRHFEHASPHGKRIFVFGGMRGKERNVESDYRRIGKAVCHHQVKLLCLTGSHPFSALIEEVKKKSPQTEICVFQDLPTTLKHIKQTAKVNDTILIKGDKKTSLDALTETFNESVCHNQCVINLAAIESNIDAIRQKIGLQTRVMVMVKALAYGTDDVQMAKFLQTCQIDILGVSYVDEGVALKLAGITQAVFVINAAPYEAYKVVKWELEVGVSDLNLIQAIELQAQEQNKVISLHLHVDTGMGRFGCRPEEAMQLALYIDKSPHLNLEGLMTHFSCADDPKEDEFTFKQATCLKLIADEIKSVGINIPWIHAANSSGALRFEFPQFNMVRIGLAVYGLYPSSTIKDKIELRLALSLFSRIVGINHCKAGETISYGRSYQVTQDLQRFAVLPIGYFDGLHRNYSGKGEVIIRGQRASMTGRICMDYMMIDVSHIPNAIVGDPVLIFGEDEYGNYLSAENLATQGNSIVHELITCLGPRIQRVFIYEESPSSLYTSISV